MTEAGGRAERLLRASDELGSRRELLRELLDLDRPVEDRAAWCVRILESDPVGVTVIAEEVIAAGRDVDALHAAFLARGDCGGRALAACLAMLLGDSARAEQHVQSAVCAGPDAARAGLALVAQALPALAESAGVRKREESSGDALTLAMWRRVAAHGLASRGEAPNAANAFALLREDASLRVVDCLRAATVSEAAGAKGWLARAQGLDPRDEEVYAARIALHQPSGRAPDMGELLSAVRDLRANVPGSKIVRLSLIREAAERGGWREALGQLREVIDDRGTPTDGAELWALVVEEASRSDAGLAEAQVAWMRGLRESRPDSPALTGALARGLVSIGKADEAEAMLRSFLSRWPEPGLRTGLEYVLREGLGRKDEADTLAIARLSEPPATEDKVIELTGLLATRGEFARAGDRVGEIKSQSGLRRLAELARTVSVRRAAEGEASKLLEAAGFISAVRDAGALTKPQAAMMRADLLLRGDPMRSAELLAAVEEAAGGVAASREQILRRITDALRAREDQRPLLRLLGEVVVSDPSNNSERGQEWLLRTAAGGQSEDARWLVERMSDQAVAEAVLSGMQDGLLEVMELEKDRKAAAAYTMGNLAQGFGRERVAHDCYAMTLEHEPGHAWAANNLGYLMLERGGDLTRSAALIEQAIEKLPGEASVIDSLGWLRYKQGKLTSRGAGVDLGLEVEQPANHAAMLELGAAEALLLASQQPDSASNEELADHLGDVAWRLGKKQDARKFWNVAAERGTRRLGATPDVPWLRHDRARLKVFIEAVRAKLRAAEDGGEPAVSAEKPPEVFTPDPEPEPIRFDRPEEAFMPENGLQMLEP
jgi:tetratricopeptide (TPR) repeat protein